MDATKPTATKAIEYRGYEIAKCAKRASYADGYRYYVVARFQGSLYGELVSSRFATLAEARAHVDALADAAETD